MYFSFLVLFLPCIFGNRHSHIESEEDVISLLQVDSTVSNSLAAGGVFWEGGFEKTWDIKGGKVSFAPESEKGKRETADCKDADVLDAKKFCGYVGPGQAPAFKATEGLKQQEFDFIYRKLKKREDEGYETKDVNCVASFLEEYCKKGTFKKEMATKLGEKEEEEAEESQEKGEQSEAKGEETEKKTGDKVVKKIPGTPEKKSDASIVALTAVGAIVAAANLF